MMLCLGTIGPDELESHLHGPNLQKQEPKSIFTSLNCNFDLLFCLVSNIPGHVDSSVVELVHYAEHPFITLQKQMKETPNQKSTKKKWEKTKKNHPPGPRGGMEVGKGPKETGSGGFNSGFL